MSSFLHDLRFAARLLFKAKGFTLVAVLALALGIGGTTVMYSAVDGVLLAAAAVSRGAAARAAVGTLGQRRQRLGTRGRTCKTGARRSRTLELLSAMSQDQLTLVRDGIGERMRAAHVTPDFFALVGAQPASRPAVLGRRVRAGQRGGADARRLGCTTFAATTEVVGKSVLLSDQSYDVVGVLPADFTLPYVAGGVYLPFVADGRRTTRDHHFMQVIGRLAPGVTLAQARAELDGIARAIAPRRAGEQRRSHGAHSLVAGVADGESASGDLAAVRARCCWC